MDAAALGCATRAELASPGRRHDHGAGSYVKVILRLPHEAERSWDRADGRLFTLLSDRLPGCVYLNDGGIAGRDHVLTALVHGLHSRALHGRPQEEIAATVIAGLEDLRPRAGSTDARCPLFADLSRWVSEVKVVDHPMAVPYWPCELGRSRFDVLADALRQPDGRVLLGGDSTESSHSDGAVRAGQRMAAWIGRQECTASQTHAPALVVRRRTVGSSVPRVPV